MSGHQILVKLKKSNAEIFSLLREVCVEGECYWKHSHKVTLGHVCKKYGKMSTCRTK